MLDFALLHETTTASNLIEHEPPTGSSFNNHWKAALLCATAAEEGQVLHPRVLHQVLFDGLPYPEAAHGLHRHSNVGVRTAGGFHTFPDHQNVARLMDEWWTYLTDDMLEDGRDLNVRNADTRWQFHAWFEAIHPFADGNGRVGRMVWWNLAMLVRVQPVLVAFEERFAYYDRLEAWRREHGNKPGMNPFK